MSDTLWSLILEVSLFGWIFTVIAFVFKSFPGRGVFDAKAARIWGGAVIVFFGIWIAGLLNA